MVPGSIPKIILSLTAIKNVNLAQTKGYLKRNKKIISIVIKLIIGFGSLFIIYARLKSDLTSEKLELLSTAAVSLKGLLCIGLCLALMPLNWGLESYKWKSITEPVQKISYRRAIRSVYSGVCLGNFAPGRATEFIAKILFFENSNRPKVTVLHFMNGMFQFSITVTVGFIALIIRLKDFESSYSWLVYVSGTIGVLMISGLIFCIYNVDKILHFIVRKISKEKNALDFSYQFKRETVIKLILVSLLRYLVFCSQFALILLVFLSGKSVIPYLTGISIYFLITASIPMFSVVEAAIRAAVALIVFKGAGVSDSVIALCTILIWLINIILPSLMGYYFLVKENFNFKLNGLKT